jgi:hypothetical protein
MKPAEDDTWRVLPHDPIEKVSENLWRVEGALPGMAMRRTMAVARRSDGRLALHSAIALDDPEMAELERFGEPSFLIIPNGWHRLDALRYKRRYPQLRVITPRGARKMVGKRMTVDGIFEDWPLDADVRLEPLPGVRDLEGVMRVRSADGLTVVLTDIVFNMDLPSGFRNHVYYRVMGSAPGPRIGRIQRVFMIGDKRVLKAELERYADLPELTRLVVSHGHMARGADAAAVLRTAAGTLA